MSTHDVLRAHLVRLLDWQDAHVTFDRVVRGIPDSLQGASPDPLPHTLWQLLEHIRFTQRDILEFCRNPKYREPHWPADYWPPTPTPPGSSAWEESVEAYRKDLEALKTLAEDASVDLFARIPHGAGQTYLRELLLVADHSAYHVGQMVTVRHRLGIWPPR